ncbi:2TM domain-containing protein [Serinicoccus kebangsaanensis]|uniref:2TM domain-containing protein n=1 Tax=Serinicoccus kebangsaanensis TaxID=2602069 RepID=UPI00124DFA98|nr:2TM domain-containing protein [Serinicoccus kebangsaanensis]
MTQPPDGPHDPVEGSFPLQPYRPSTELDPEMRKRALARIEQRKEFRQHLSIYLIIMTMLTLIWLVTSGWGEYFWPIWPMMGWGVGVAIHGASLALDKEPTEKEIAEEAARLRKRLGRPDHPED